MSCVYANVGKPGGVDEYIYQEFNLCGF